MEDTAGDFNWPDGTTTSQALYEFTGTDGKRGTPAVENKGENARKKGGYPAMSCVCLNLMRKSFQEEKFYDGESTACRSLGMPILVPHRQAQFDTVIALCSRLLAYPVVAVQCRTALPGQRASPGAASCAKGTLHQRSLTCSGRALPVGTICPAWTTFCARVLLS